MQNLPPGTRIGNYKILKALGRGGFGVTYIAWDTQLERNVVLKECFPAAICRRDDDGTIRPLRTVPEELYLQAMADLQREARTLAKLNHERVVRVYEVFESHGGLYYVMPWLEGGSLREKIDEAADAGVRISPQLATQWLLDVLDGLQYLHDKGIIHRDIKPGNILFDEAERPVIIDFGASVMCSSHTMTQGEFSAAYAAPEQITGKGTPFAGTDLFALAASTYEMLSGSLPEATLPRLLKDDLVPLQELPGMATTPPPLVHFVMHNLQVFPEARDKSAAYWRDVLSGLIPSKLPPRRRSLMRAWPWLLVLAGVVSVCSVALYMRAGEGAARTVEAPKSPSVQELPREELLFSAYVTHNKAVIDTWPAAHAKYCAEMETIFSDYDKAAGDLIKQLEQELATLSPNEEELEELVYRYKAESDALYRRFDALRMDAMQRFFREFFPLVDSVLSQPEKHYTAFIDSDRPFLFRLVERLQAEYDHYLRLPIRYNQIHCAEVNKQLDAVIEAYAASLPVTEASGSSR